MKINPVVLKTVINNYNHVVRNVPANKPLAAKDEVSFSKDAKFISQAVKAAKATDEVSTKKVQEVASKISAGTYEYNAQKVAERIVGQALFDKKA